ncbi:FAD-dependent oxidoreductase [Granulosicoccaceae sp. 1_MG-2023]|nr:FAD-dependent oxidoreductase [Granulosicoccaceae sp. 1_MG-2023]
MSKRITIVGAGFGALTAIRRIRKADKDVAITVIAPKAEFVYYPSLIWVPSGKRRRQDIAISLENFFNRRKVHFHPHAAKAIHAGGRLVETTSGTVENDGLIIASGARYLQQLPGIEHACIPCRSVEDAERVRDRIAAMDGGTIAFGFSGNPEEGSAMRGGPVFEFVFGTERYLRQKGLREKFRLVFFCPSPRPGQRMGEKAVERLLEQMRRHRIELHIGHKLKGFEAGRICTAAGDFDADLIVFIPGMTGHSWLQSDKLPLSPGGLLRADAHCQVEGMKNVYAIGDCASLPGPDWMPKQAHMADLQGACAAKNLLASLQGKAANATFRTELACIVDSGDSGMFVWRSPGMNFMLPQMRPLHWLKRFFEWWYLRQYR